MRRLCGVSTRPWPREISPPWSPALSLMRCGTCPGKSPIAGDHHGWPAIRDDFLARLGPLSGQTFRAELLDIAVGQNFVVAVQRATAACQGRRLDVTGCQLMRLDEGRIAEVRGHYSDQYALDAFWAAE
jgi:ketosteroid isomerase-like protein